MNFKIIVLVGLGTLLGLVAFSILQSWVDHTAALDRQALNQAAALDRQAQLEDEQKRIEQKALELRPQIFEQCMDREIGRYTTSQQADLVHYTCDIEAKEQAIARAREAQLQR